MSRLGPLARSLAIAALLAQACSGLPDTSSGDAPGGSSQLSATTGPTAAEPPATASGAARPLQLGTPVDPIIVGNAEDGRDDTLYRGLAVGSGFVVGGEHPVSEDRPVDAVIWTSTDGRSWVRATAVDNGFREAHVGRLVTNGEMILALGQERSTVDPEDEPRIRVAWRSADGLVWERVEPVDVDLASISLAGAFGDPGGFIVWGNRFFPGDSGPEVHGQILVSEDGIDWSVAADFDEADVLDVKGWAGGYVAVGEGRPQVCVGDDCSVYTDGPGVAWWSSDGVTWESAGDELGSGMSGVYPLADGMFAVGRPHAYEYTSRTYWHSGDDGRSWSIVADDQEWRRGIASDGETVMLWDRPAPQLTYRGPGLIQASTDGISWHEMGMLGSDDTASSEFVIGANGLLLVLETSSDRALRVLFVPYA